VIEEMQPFLGVLWDICGFAFREIAPEPSETRDFDANLHALGIGLIKFSQILA
jgi:hypothetical protein